MFDDEIMKTFFPLPKPRWQPPAWVDFSLMGLLAVALMLIAIFVVLIPKAHAADWTRVYTHTIDLPSGGSEFDGHGGLACTFAIDADNPKDIVIGNVYPSGGVVLSLQGQKTTLDKRSAMAAELRKHCFATEGV